MTITTRQGANRVRSLLEWADDHDTLPGGWTLEVGPRFYDLNWHPALFGEDADEVRAAIEAVYGRGEDRLIDRDGYAVTQWPQEGARPAFTVYGTTRRAGVA